MKSFEVHDLNIAGQSSLPCPRKFLAEHPAGPEIAEFICNARQRVCDILAGRDSRLVLIVGPCSISDPAAALEYAKKLKELSLAVSGSFQILLRTYFEKPRTALGWKGFLNDPGLDGKFDIVRGLTTARRLLLDMAKLELPVATEFLGTITPQYFGDLVTWSCIGARTSESPAHRDLASGLSMPTGFKNAVCGDVATAIHAVQAASCPQHFLGLDMEGKISIFHTRGNPYTHIVLRGGEVPNYDEISMARCEKALVAAGLPSVIFVDCSHGNSQKKPERQPLVLNECVRQIRGGNRSIRGFLMESNLFGGCQELAPNRVPLQYGVSITDACLGWAETKTSILEAHSKLRSEVKVMSTASVSAVASIARL